MDGKIEQCVCIKFCVKLGASATETLDMLREAFGEYSLSRTTVFEWHSRFKAGRGSVENDEHSGDQSPRERQKVLKIFENSSMKTIAEKSMSSQTRLGSVMEFARRC
jgi:hypothetical protein